MTTMTGKELERLEREEIKQKAWELSKTALFRTIAVEGKNLKTPDQVMSWCLTIAESFYNLAKEKEREGERIPSPCDIAAQVFHESLKEKEKEKEKTND